MLALKMRDETKKEKQFQGREKGDVHAQSLLAGLMP